MLEMAPTVRSLSLGYHEWNLSEDGLMTHYLMAFLGKA